MMAKANFLFLARNIFFKIWYSKIHFWFGGRGNKTGEMYYLYHPLTDFFCSPPPPPAPRQALAPSINFNISKLVYWLGFHPQLLYQPISPFYLFNLWVETGPSLGRQGKRGPDCWSSKSNRPFVTAGHLINCLSTHNNFPKNRKNK